MRAICATIGLLLVACTGIENAGHPYHCEASDLDGDGFAGAYVAPNGDSSEVCGDVLGPDCDDGDPAIHPGALETCNGQDDDCDGRIDPDLDGDGFLGCEDCNDWDASIHPGAAELCNEVDDDCNGLVDDGDDLDGDGCRG